MTRVFQPWPPMAKPLAGFADLAVPMLGQRAFLLNSFNLFGPVGVYAGSRSFSFFCGLHAIKGICIQWFPLRQAGHVLGVSLASGGSLDSAPSAIKTVQAKGHDTYPMKATILPTCRT